MNSDEGVRSVRIAVIGSGPSGLYAAEALAKQTGVPVSVDVFERLPTPYGLVRYGVAPDHQKIKSVTTALQRVLEHPFVRFFGNVEYGRDITREDLARHYDATIYAVGAVADRAMNIPGEDLPGNLSATEFVAWYNGHPDSDPRSIPLTANAVAVVGLGNVAVDVARILAKTPEELRETDIADYALEALARSSVTNIVLLGRRGPAQAKFTTKELKELGELRGADIIVWPEDVALTDEEEAAITDSTVRRNLEVLRGFSRKPLQGKPRSIHIRFLVSPVEVLGKGHVEGLRIERNMLDEQENALGTGRYELLPVQMVMRAVGYKGRALPDLPFNPRNGTIPNQEGRILRDGQPSYGEYTAGWIKRGRTGIIGTNKSCATETVNVLLHDLPNLPRAAQPDPSAIVALLNRRQVAYVTLDHWLRLDRHEQTSGKDIGRPRVKVVTTEAMLQVMGRE